MRKLIVMLLAVCVAVAVAQDYRRPIPRRSKPKEPQKVEAVSDTSAHWNDSIDVAGFEKTLRAVRESMFLTNRSSAAIAGIELEITYLDTSGRMLHKVTHTVSVDIPPGETRRIEVPAFDRQGLFYYKLSPLPPRASRATPFDVKVRITNITLQ